MNRFILSILSLAVAVSVGACNKNSNPRRKPVPGPNVAEEKKPAHYEDDDAPPKRKPERDEVVDPTPAVKNKIPDAPVKLNPEYANKAEGKPGYVSSPYDPQHRLIDVRGLPPGTEAECPYTRRTFLVPP
ncbi:MAG: hypothetical protein ABIP85_19315 [Chthoniobacteraceae bacterium]